MSALRAGVWHQECPECHARRLSPNVDPQSLSCDECGYTTVAPNVSVSAPAEDRTPGDICGDVRLFADEYLYDDPAWSLPMLGGTNADNPMRAVWRGGHLDRRNREQRLVDFAREKVAETVHHFRSGELKGFDCAPQTLGLDKLCDAVVLATVRALAPASAAMPPVSAPAEDRTPSDAMCTICGNPRHYPALAEQCVGWHSIGLADVVDWPLEGEDAPAEDRTPTLHSLLSELRADVERHFSHCGDPGVDTSDDEGYIVGGIDALDEMAIWLTAALDRVRDDAERADWFDAHPNGVGYAVGYLGDKSRCWVAHIDGEARLYDTWRAAVDAARTQPEGSND